VDNLTIEPMVMYELIREGAPPAVDVNGVPTHPTTPLTKAHYEPFDVPEPQEDSITFSSLKTTYQLPAFSITSSTGFWHRNSITRQDSEEQIASALGIPVYAASAGGMGPLVSSRGPGIVEQDASHQVSEELRLTSTRPNRYHLEWVIGYFYQDLFSEDIQQDSAPEASAIFGGPNMFFMYMPEDLVQNAQYGNISWRFLPHWKASIGLRHYHYSMSNSFMEYGAFAATAVFGNSVPYRSSASISQGGTTPSFTLTYNFDSAHMIYLRATKGFRLGGVSEPVPVVAASNTNPIYASQVANECALQAKLLLSTTCDPNLLLQAQRTFGSDWVWSYELGEKSSFLDDRMIINVDAYLENWNNPQVQTFLAGFPVTVNSANARIKGVELEIDTILPAGFTFALNGAFTDARFLKDSALTGFSSGALVPDIARLQGSAVLNWRRALGGDRSLFGTLEEDYTGTRTDIPYGETVTLQNINQYLVHLQAYSTVNVRLGIEGETSDGNVWKVSGFINNLTNSQVLVDPQPQIGLQTPAFSRFTISQPLTAGIDMSYSFR
jgi:outer membrane receptor protein involved in Fe transport